MGESWPRRVGALCWGERGAGPSTATLPALSPSIRSRTSGTAVSRGAGHQGSSCCLCGRITDIRALCAALPSRWRPTEQLTCVGPGSGDALAPSGRLSEV